MSHLGFGRKAMHGAPDIKVLVPASTTQGCGVGEQRAKDMAAALGNCNATHGGWGTDNTCGDHLRAAIINDPLDGKYWHVVGHERNLHNDHPHAGYPNLDVWPHHSSILHQQMWWEWIKRAHQGGLRVMVALTVNSETLAEVLNGDRPYDDKTVADVQIAETIRMVDQHRDFMEIAYSSADAERIVKDNRLAVILGMEVDKIGNFGKPGVKTDDAAVIAEIKRLMGHNGLREAGGNERGAPVDVVRRIAKLGGMMGAGTAEANPTDFIESYRSTLEALQAGASESGSVTGLGLGTDANGFERHVVRRCVRLDVAKGG